MSLFMVRRKHILDQRNHRGARRKFITLKLRAFLAILLIAIGTYLQVSIAHAATLTWDGGGADNNWSTCANWTTDACPQAADSVIFNGTSTKNASINAAFQGTVSSISINAGYTGTVTASRSFTVSNTFSQASGSFNAGGQTLQFNNLSLTGGSFTASSGTTSLGGSLTINPAATFNHNNGTLNLIGIGPATYSCNNTAFNLVTINKNYDGYSTSTMNSNCTFPLGNNPTIKFARNTFIVNGTLTGSGTLSIAGDGTFLGNAVTIQLNATGQLSGFTGLDRTVTGSLIVNGANLNLSGYNPVTLTDLVLQNGGVFTAPSGVMNLGGNLTINPGTTFNHSNGTLNLFGIAATTYSCNNAVFNLVTINKNYDGYSTSTMNSDCTFPLGNNPTIKFARNTFVINGTLTGSGTLSIAGDGSFLGNAVTIQINPTGQLSGFTSIDRTVTGSLIVNGANFNLSGYDPVTLTDLVLQNGAVFTAPSGVMNLSGNLTINPGTTFNHNNGTVAFNGYGQTIDCANFHAVSFTGGITTFNGACTLPLGNNPNLTWTTLAGNGSLILAGTGTLSIYGLTVGSNLALSGFSGLTTTSNLTISGTTFDASQYADIAVGGHFSLTNGATFIAPIAQMSIGGDLVVNSGTTFNTNNGSVLFNGYDQTIDCADFHSVGFTDGTKTFNGNCTLPLGSDPHFFNTTFASNGHLTLAGTGTLNTGALTLNNSLALSGFNGLTTTGDLVVDSGTFDASQYPEVAVGASLRLLNGAIFTAPTTLNVHDNFFAADGRFQNNGGTVNFTCGHNELSGLNTFYNLTAANCSGGDIIFPAGETQVFEGALTITGTSRANMIRLRSSADGSQWNIDARGAVSLNYVDIKDAHNVNSNIITATRSVDSGNNSRATIVAPPPFKAYAANDLLGQIDTSGTPVWSGSGSNNGAGYENPNREGVDYPQGTVIDTKQHRLFVANCGSRVLVYNLDANNALIDRLPDYVLGQKDFTSNDQAVSQSTLNCPVGMSYDSLHQRLFVPDDGNSRVMVFDLSRGITNGMDAAYVLGQPDFTANSCNLTADSPTQNTLCYPYGGSAYDETTQYLYVSDSSNDRVLVFDLSQGITNGMNATYVIGQPNFTSNTGAITRTGMSYPYGMALDTVHGRLFVADDGCLLWPACSARVLVYDIKGGITNGMGASYVLGEPDFTSGINDRYNVHVYTPHTILGPENLAYDFVRQRLFVQDDILNRVLVFDLSNGIVNNMDATAVIGQEDFTTSDYSCVTSQMNQCDAEGQSDAFDAINNRYYLSDSSDNRILIFNFVNITTPSLPGVRQGDYYHQTISAINSQGDITYKVVNGSMPSGLVLSADGVLSGVATTPGSYTFTVEVKDDNGPIGYFTDRKEFTIVVSAKDVQSVVTQKPTASTGLPSAPSDSDMIILNSYPEYTSGDGKYISSEQGSSVTFYIANTTTGATDQKHVITVKSITTDSVTLTFASDPFDVSFRIGDTKDIDLNKDNRPDITVTLNGITNGLADIIYKEYKAPEPDSKASPQSELSPSKPVIVNKNSSDTPWFLIIAIAALVPCGIYVARRFYKVKNK